MQTVSNVLGETVSGHRRSLALYTASILLLLGVSVSESLAVEPILNLKIEDITLTPDDSIVDFQVTMNSVEDSVAGIELMFQMSNPYVMEFSETDPVDLTGSTIEDWGTVTWKEFGNPVSTIKIVGLWDFPDGSKRPIPIPPSDEPQLLLTLHGYLINVYDDSLCDFEAPVYIADYETKFSTPVIDSLAYLIGYDMWIEYDTTYDNCVEWDGDSCVAWADTIVEVIPHSAPNFDLLNYQDGSYRILCFDCGDADGSGAIDIDDVVYLIDYIFAQGPAPDPIEAGDADASGAVDIDDVVYLIAYIFSSGPGPCAVF